MGTGYTPPFVGSAGLTIPTYAEILADNIAKFQAIYGSTFYLGIDSPIYQLLSILSLKQWDTLTALQFAYNQSSPTTAVGVGLDRIVKLNGIARLPYSYSTAQLTITGTPGVVILNGEAQDANSNLWLLPASVTIPGGGSITVQATCATPGAITAGIDTINIIATPQGGWVSVNNSAAAVPGTAIETDSQLRARQALSVTLPSITLFAGTVADLLALPGIGRVTVLENPTGSIDSYGNPPHSITCVVEPGVVTTQQIAQTIYNNRGIGCLTNGDVDGSPISQTVTIGIADPDTGWVIQISFISPPVYVPIYVTINVHLLAGGTSATLAQIQADIVAYLNSLEIGESVIYGEIWGAALNARSNPDAPTFSIRSVATGETSSPSGTTDIALEFYQVSQGITGNIVVNSV